MAEWDGVARRELYKDRIVVRRDRLADGARDGDWSVVFGVLDEEPVAVNSARLDGRSGYRPLHQAAWHGAPAETVERLLGYGAWRTLRAADGSRAVDVAARRGHGHLTGLLEPTPRRQLPPEVLDPLQRHLHRLIRYRAGGYTGRTDVATRNGLRLPEVEVMTETDRPALWFPVPGMYGGFKIRLHDRELVVDSWIRVVGGSERTDRVTVDGVELQEGERL